VPFDFEPDRIQRAKDDFLSTTVIDKSIGVELERSWQRSRQALGTPANVVDVPQVAEELLDAHLLNMFQAPLTRFADSLAGTGLGVLLADSTGQILQRWCGDRSAAAHLDRIGTMRGAVLAEDVVGTNGVGTVAATGRSVQIRGVEHFADFYSNAVCTGAPVRHPVTGKLLGVVTLSCEITPRADLLRPMLETLTQQLEQHVLEMEQPATSRMFNAFLTLTRTHADPVIAFGPLGLLIQNPQANRLSSEDLRQIRQVCEDNMRTGKYSLSLSTGVAKIQVTAIEPGNSVVIVLEQEPRARPVRRSVDPPARTPELVGRSPQWLSVVHQLSMHQGSSTSLVIAGESGVGKVSLALGTPFQPGLACNNRTIIDAAERHIVGGRKWLRQVSNRLSSGERLLIRGVQTLDDPVLDGLRSLLESTPNRGPVLLTLTATRREDAEAFGLRFGTGCVYVPPLRERTADIPALWRAMRGTIDGSAGLDLRPDTLEVMQSYQWPGNLKEFRTVLVQLVTARKDGPITPADLPPAMHGGKALSLIERVELEAIRKALAEAHGNRGRAAEILGLSRATVYRKMKAYRLSV
jgi:transcriptional regulator of acetoin/glycerol metabolism